MNSLFYTLSVHKNRPTPLHHDQAHEVFLLQGKGSFHLQGA